VMTSCPVGVTTTSSSMRAAVHPSVEGQNVSSANTIPGLISYECSSETSRLIIGFSQMARPMPWPICSAKAASSFGNPNSGAVGQTPAISAVVRPGRTTAQVASVWPKAQEFGFPDEEAAFALQFGHGVGLAIWEKPVISRMVSLEHAHELKPGMVFALETFWPSTDGWSAARIEEEIVVTETGHEVITKFPAEQLMVAGAHYFTVNGPLPTTRESEAAPSKHVVEMVEASAKSEGVGVL